jgi:hypothetical protein
LIDTINRTRASPVLNQPAPATIGKTEDQKLGSSERIQSIDAKLAEKARTTRPIPLNHESAGRIGSPPARGAHSAKAASKFHNRMWTA